MTPCIDTREMLPVDVPAAARAPARLTPARVVARIWAATRHGMALVGLATLVALALLAAHPELRADVQRALVAGWTADDAADAVSPVADADADISDRVLAADPQALPPEQARVAQWLARKYRVASEPIGALVAEAYQLGPQLRLDPALILAVMAIESRFNPFAASPWGAHGLMQVHTRVHADKFEALGGTLAVFDPLSNLRVGATILQDAVRRAGSIPGGLRLYVGAVASDGADYIVKVLSEYERLKRVHGGQRVAFQAAMPLPEGVLPPAAPAATRDDGASAIEVDAAPRAPAGGPQAS
ncbi:MAG: lytic transglycosylase domain-containing protein [Tepidimonas taiwanensis]|nr:lytic transglycosylase domain-containing protein [Tepidimonas taiwanensis]